jgi:hypothetical protein
MLYCLAAVSFSDETFAVFYVFISGFYALISGSIIVSFLGSATAAVFVLRLSSMAFSGLVYGSLLFYFFLLY